MGLLLRHENMIKELSKLLRENEILEMPFYGVITKLGSKNGNQYAYIGKAGNNLLIVIMSQWDTNLIEWTARLTLDIKKVEIKKLLLSQYKVKIYFNNGKPCTIQFARKMLTKNFAYHEENTGAFLNYMEQFV